MKTELTFVALIALASALALFVTDSQESISKFDQWKQTYGVDFDPSEDVYRKIIFEQNLQLIQKHNSDPTQTYKMTVNQFTAFT
jgi:hypothetical protein